MKIEKFSISDQININFKNYAIYTLQHRGIPSFEDSLTNVQRLILLAAKTEFTKTLTLVGDVIKLGYHHGNSSLEKAINRLARPFNVANQLLEGDGFFGTYVNPAPSAARYTSIKINSVINKIINEYKHLNEIDEEGNYKPLNITIPIGLLIPTIGIAVGYKTLILPRKLNDLQDFIQGKITECPPSIINYPKNLFKKFKKDNKSVWLFESELIIDPINHTIRITNIPPMLSYDSFIKKLDKIIEPTNSFYKNNPNINIINNSKDNVDILIKIKDIKSSDDFDILVEKIKKITSIIVQEKIVFIYNGKLLQYNCVEDYLKDFIVKNERIFLKNIEWHINQNSNELKFQEAKLKFLEFMYGIKRTDNQIQDFYKNYSTEITQKLDNIPAKIITKEEIEKTKQIIVSLNKIIKIDKNKYKKQFKIVNSLPKKLHNQINNSSIELDDIKEIDGIEVFKFEDEFEDEFKDEI